MSDTPNSEPPSSLQRFRAEALGRGIPSEDVDRWLELGRPCAVLCRDEDGPVVGRLGGPVMLPPGVPVPADSFTSMGRSYEMPYHLIADLDLAALPGDATDLPMPPGGRLLLFAIPALDGAAGAAVYVPEGTPVEERPMEFDYDPGDHLASLDFENELRGELHLKPCVSLPNHEIADDEVTVDTAEHPRAEELREVWEEIWGEERRVSKWSQLQIGGYAWDGEGWGDPVVDCVRESGEEETRLRDWALLAEWRPAMTGLEMATMYWAIRRQDLAARRFDRTAVTMYANP